jgi:hypothetical protein
MNELQELAIRRALDCARDASDQYVQLSIKHNFSSENCRRDTEENICSSNIREIARWLEAILKETL